MCINLPSAINNHSNDSQVSRLYQSDINHHVLASQELKKKKMTCQYIGNPNVLTPQFNYGIEKNK